MTPPTKHALSVVDLENAQLRADLAAAQARASENEEFAEIGHKLVQLVEAHTFECDESFEPDDVLESHYNELTQLRADIAAKVEWQIGTPNIPKNSQKAFWVAFKSKDVNSDKICHRFLMYCNEEIMPLSDLVNDDHEPKNAVPVGDDGEYAWTGWFQFSCDHCDTQWCFDGEVIAWMELPAYASTLAVNPANKP